MIFLLTRLNSNPWFRGNWKIQANLIIVSGGCFKFLNLFFVHHNCREILRSEQWDIFADLMLPWLNLSAPPSLLIRVSYQWNIPEPDLTAGDLAAIVKLLIWLNSDCTTALSGTIYIFQQSSEVVFLISPDAKKWYLFIKIDWVIYVLCLKYIFNEKLLNMRWLNGKIWKKKTIFY